jgi:2-methylcitrate dehydratase PrpD
MIAEHHLDVAEIASIKVALPSESAVVVDNRAMPNVNVQYLVAGTLLDGGFSMRMSQDADRLADPVVRSLMDRIALVGEEDFAHQRAARVEINLREGAAVLSKTVRDVRGTPKNPMSFDESRTKAEDLIGEVTGDKRAAAACDLVAHLEDVTDLGELVELLVEH